MANNNTSENNSGKGENAAEENNTDLANDQPLDLEISGVSETSVLNAIEDEGELTIPRDQIIAVSQHRSGPIPSPAELEAYDEIVPGSAQQIFTDLHSQTKHRMDLEKKDSEASIFIAKRESDHRASGLKYAFLLGLAIIVVGGYCIHLGHPASGSTIIVGTLATGIGCLIYGSRNMQYSPPKKDADEFDEPVE